jgi:tetratricopeptide (TPR) repeat protein
MQRALHHCSCVLGARQEALGCSHHDTLSALHSVGMIKRVLGRQSEALKDLQDAAEGLQRVHGVHHPVALRAVNDVAVTLHLFGSQGQQQQASCTLQEAIAAADAAIALQAAGVEGGAVCGSGPAWKLLQELHDVRSSLLSNLGAAYCAMGQHELALGVLQVRLFRLSVSCNLAAASESFLCCMR